MTAGSREERREASLLEPGVLIPFVIVTLIWGSTWLVIRHQISDVPPSWSVCYRFLLAATGMFALAAVRRVPLNLGTAGFAFAACLALAQFVANFNFVYRAEQHLTSGIVAVLYALLLIPNSLLAWIVFRQPVTRGFLIGSAIAVAGVALLFLREYRTAAVDPGAVLAGLLLSLGGLMSASAANIMQGTRIAHRLPMVAVLAWAMLIGGAMDGALAWAIEGPPVFDASPAYLFGVAYLGIAGSVITFPLYFRLIQRIGAGRAAYNGVLVPVIAMLLSTLFEGYAWSGLAAAGAALSLVGTLVAMGSRRQAASPSR